MTRPRKTLKTAPAGMRLDAQTHRIPAGGGHGVDVASQRADDLDERCLAFLDARFARDLTTRPSALDVACGQGGQAIRLAAAGCRVTAVDIQDHAADIRRAASYHRVRQPPIFLQADLRALPAVLPEAPFDALICQRALHYIRYAEAVAAVASWRRHLAPGARPRNVTPNCARRPTRSGSPAGCAGNVPSAPRRTSTSCSARERLRS